MLGLTPISAFPSASLSSGADYSATYDEARYDYSQYGVVFVNVAAGSFTLTGQPATFLRHYVVPLGSGGYDITGQNAGFLYDQILQANGGSYSYTGKDARLEYNQILNAGTGSYTLTGNSATFLYNQTIYAGAFSFIWTGNQAGLIKDAKLNANSGAYTFTGNASALLPHYAIIADAGNYVFTGNNADLEKHEPAFFVESKGGIDKKKKTKLSKEKEQREELEAIVKREFDILDGTYEPEVVEVAKEVILPKIQEIDYTQYAIALAQVNELLLQAKIQAAEYQAELDDEEALLMLL